MNSGLVETPQLAPADFNRLAAFIHATTGIKMAPGKQSMLEGRLRRRVAASGAGTYAAYCARVLDDGDPAELVELIDAVTTNKTDFFREPKHFHALTQSVLPAMAAPHRKLKIWSSACSTGPEPYTLAMVLAAFIETQRTRGVSIPPPAILATDLCTTALEMARLGIYPEAAVAPVPKPLRERYVRRARDPARGEVRIVAPLRAMLQFGRLNLMAPHYEVGGEFDVIFCRNVLIYFDREGQASVLRKLCDCLRVGGTLVLGHSETLNGLNLPVRPIGHTMFQRL